MVWQQIDELMHHIQAPPDVEIAATRRDKTEKVKNEMSLNPKA
jgi:hypothetical protein